MKLAIIEYKRRKYLKSVTALFKKVLNGLLADYVSRCQGKTIQALKDEADKPILPAPFEEAMIRTYVAVGTDFAKTTLKEVRNRKSYENIETDFWEEYFKRYALQHAGRKITLITGTTEQVFKDTVNRIILESPEKGIYDILSRIQDELTIKNQYRAERIARTEVTAASNAGSYEAAKNSGIELRKVWSAILDENTRDAHASMHGEVRRMDEAFSNGQMMPGEGDADEVINCRCGIDYITSDDERFR